MASRPVHFFWVVDTSASMSVDGRMDRLNHSIREALPEMRSVAEENPGAELLIRVLAFASGTRWINPDPVAVNDFSWTPIPAEGLTDLGEALSVVASQLEVPPMPERALPPVVCVVTDGMPTDDWRLGLAQFDRSTWGPKAVRMAIAIETHDSNDVLRDFTKNPELVFNADRPEELAKAIRFASTVAIKVASDTTSGGRATAVLSQHAVQLDDTLTDDDDDEFV
jgi:uncharacterized protein YegL